MVMQDRNHPSVILWSIGNEVGGSTTATATSLKSWVLAMDATRALTWAINKMGGHSPRNPETAASPRCWT